MQSKRAYHVSLFSKLLMDTDEAFEMLFDLFHSVGFGTLREVISICLRHNPTTLFGLLLTAIEKLEETRLAAGSFRS